MRKTQTTEYLRSVPLGIPHLRGHHGMHFLHVLVIHKTPSCSTCPLLPTKSSLNFTTFSATDFLRAQSKRKSAEKIMSNRAAFSMIQFFFFFYDALFSLFISHACEPKSILRYARRMRKEAMGMAWEPSSLCCCAQQLQNRGGKKKKDMHMGEAKKKATTSGEKRAAWAGNGSWGHSQACGQLSAASPRSWRAPPAGCTREGYASKKNEDVCFKAGFFRGHEEE